MIRIVVLFTYLLHFVSSQNVPTIVGVSPLLIKDVNETAEIFCKVKDLGRSSIMWTSQKGIKTVLSINDLLRSLEDRISVKFENISSIATSTVRIANLQTKDAAVYRCSVNLPNGEEADKDVTLQVRSPPFFVGNTTDKVTTALNGSVTLECYGGGYPTPNVTWSRENNALLPNGLKTLQNNILKIANVQKEHAGNYYCTMVNEITSIKKNYVVTVDYPPIVKPRYERVGQAIGHETYLECLIESSPAVVISWLHDNIPVTDNQFFTQSQSAINEPLRSGVLKIKVDRRQYGMYTCVAKNDAGNGSANIELYQTEKEVCVQNCNVNSGHSIISMLDLKLSLTGVIMLMFHWQNM